MTKLKRCGTFVFSLAVIFIYLACGAILGSGQVVTRDQASAARKQLSSDDIKQLTTTNSDSLIDVTNRAAIPARQAQLAAQAPSGKLDQVDQFGPGDKPIFIPKVNQIFFRRNDTMKLSLIAMFTANHRPLSITITELDPNGQSGEYNGDPAASYFPAETGDYGRIEGFRQFQEINIYTKLFGSRDNLGRHTFNVVAYKDNGTPEQQMILDVYLVNAGTYGRWFAAKTVSSSDTGYTLTGSFPANVPIFYYIGANDAGGLITGTDPQYAAYSNGTRLVLSGRMYFSRTTLLDAFTWAAYTRYAIPVADLPVDDMQGPAQ